MKKALFCLLLFYPYYVFAVDISPQEVKNLLYHGDVQNVVNDLWDNAENWEFITEEISKGNSDWISIIPNLISGADTNVAESLGIALAVGLSANPSAVFSAIDDKTDAISTERICTMYYIEPSHESLYHYYEVTHKKLSEIKGENAQKCLTALDGAMEYIKLQELQNYKITM